MTWVLVIMLSISAMASGQDAYYLSLAKEDYYLQGGEPPGRWAGGGAAALGLDGVVEARPFTAVFNGYSPHGVGADPVGLVGNAGADDRQPGWDHTFTAPKSVSVFWSQAGAADRASVQAAHAAAVKVAFGYLQDEWAWTRRGKGGAEVERCGLVAAMFEHGTSRAQDPNLHTHVLILNVGVRADGTTGTILSRPQYEAKMTVGAVYRAELAHQLQLRLGLECRAEKTWFELPDVSQEARDAFSTRRREIQAALSESGRYGARAAEYAALGTRAPKECRARADLFHEWQEVGPRVGFGPEQARELGGRVRPHRNPAELLQSVLPESAASLADSLGHFSERALLRRTAEAVQADGVPVETIRAAVKTYLHHSPDLVRLGVRERASVYTTTDLYRTEQDLLKRAEAGHGRRQHDLPNQLVDDTLAAFPRLNAEQADALRHLARGGGTVRIVSGLAGTGKTTLLNAARDAWERGGRTVIGATLAGKAAQGLQDGAGIASETIHRRLTDLDAGRLTLDAGSVLVVDEAGMVGTRLLARLTAHADKAGALLVLVGDHRQLQSVDAGGAFKALGERLGTAELTQITRQEQRWARDAVRRVVEGDAAGVLRQYADRGLLTPCANREAAFHALAADWGVAGAESPERHLIFAADNRDARRLNQLCQAERSGRGFLHGPRVDVGGELVRAGDRVLFTRNSKFVGVKNGSLGTVTDVNPSADSLRVRLDDGKSVSVHLSEYAHLRLGYAVTTHKGQGVTVDHAYVLAGGPMSDRELAYVQLSRARRATRIYVDRAELGENFADLARAMSRSRQHTIAHDVVPVAAGPNPGSPDPTHQKPAPQPGTHHAPDPLRPEVSR
jgi:conjugative relaxase-like TrwC/TraI family protein